MAWWVGTVNEEKEFLEPIWISRAKENLGEIPETQDELVRELKKLVDDEDGLKVPDDKKFYLMFLRSGMMIPRQGFEVMKNYFLFKKDNPRYFKSSTELERLVRSVFSQMIHSILPQRDQEGRKIYIFRPGRWDPDKIPFEDVFCVGYMLYELGIKEEKTQIAGCVTVTDASGFGFKQMKAIGFEGKNLARFCNICFPMCFRQSHIMNAPGFFMMLFAVLRPLLNDSISDNCYFHSGDLSSIRDYISGDVLPSDLGGNGTMGLMDNEHNVNELRKMESFFENIRHFGYQ